jgi:beta-phosphoglucomutase
MSKAIIFDLDGVVVDTERTVWFKSSVELLHLYGMVHEEKKVKPLIMGSKFEVATRILYDYYKINDSFESFLKNRRRLVLKGFAENVMFMDGFKDFYQRLENRKKAIATSMDDTFLELTLEHLPLRSFFGEHIYTVAQVGGKGKPHPDIFLYAAGKIGEDPGNCIVIEDAPKGITAAKSAGMKAIALTTSVSSEHLGHADYIVNSFLDITDAMLQ